MQYRRNHIEGGSYFFTVNLAERKGRLLVEHIDALRESIRIVRSRHPFQIDAMVVMPNHLHALVTLPPDDANYSTRWMLIKAGFSRRIPKVERINASRRSKGERGIWQRRFWEHTIQDDADFYHHIDYIHYNPVKHGYVTSPADWPHSSIHKYIRAGKLPKQWGTSPIATISLGGVGWGEVTNPNKTTFQIPTKFCQRDIQVTGFSKAIDVGVRYLTPTYGPINF